MAGGGRSTHIHTQHSWAAFQWFLAQPEYISECNRCNPVHWLWHLNQGHMHRTCCDFAAKSTWVNSEFAQRWMILTFWLIWFLEKFQSFLLYNRKNKPNRRFYTLTATAKRFQANVKSVPTVFNSSAALSNKAQRLDGEAAVSAHNVCRGNRAN